MLADAEGATSRNAPIWANGEWAGFKKGAPTFMPAFAVVGSTSTGVCPSTWNVSRCAAGSHFIRSVWTLPKNDPAAIGTVLADELEITVPVSGELLSQRKT